MQDFIEKYRFLASFEELGKSWNMEPTLSLGDHQLELMMAASPR